MFLLIRPGNTIELLEEGNIVGSRVRLSIGSQHTLLHLYAYLDLRLPAYIHIPWEMNRKSRELIHVHVAIRSRMGDCRWNRAFYCDADCQRVEGEICRCP